jgi:hypothetical protein
VLALGAAGWLPTRRLAGTGALGAGAAGCGISLLSAAMAGWLIVAMPADSPQARMQRAFLAMGIRVVAVLVLGVAAALSGMFQRAPLLIWLVIAYAGLLPLEVMLALAPDGGPEDRRPE